MKNLDRFKKFYDKVNNPLTEENLEVIVNKWQESKSLDQYYKKMTEDNYPKFRCGLTDDSYNYHIKNKGKWHYYGDMGIDEAEKIKHQLFISAGIEMQDRIIQDFIDGCDRNEISFLLKATPDKRNDNIVLYATDENFFDYLELLRTLGWDLLRFDDILKRSFTPAITGLLEPSILTGRVCSWVGYGAKPKDCDTYIESRVNFLDESIPNVIDKDSKIADKKAVLEYLKRYLIRKGEENNIDPDNFAFSNEFAEEIKTKVKKK